MTNGAHDVSLMALIVDGVAHRFSIDGETFVLLSIDLVPALQCTVQMHGIHAGEHIADDGQARHDVAPVFVSAAETFPGFFSEAFGPIRDGQIASHTT